ncbi:MAG: zinc-binding dehydrogenase, partial [Nakamurella multipartita]
AAAAPDGIDVFFDNVGGEHLEAALDALNPGGRVALCGAISAYNETGRPAGPSNMSNIITRGLTLKGFTLGGYFHLSGEFSGRMTEWFSAGEIAYDETIVDGIEHAVDAFLDMMRGANTGKMLVRVGSSD